MNDAFGSDASRSAEGTGSPDGRVRAEVVDGNVAVLTLADPERRNALTLEMTNDLAAAVGWALAKSVGAIVLAADPPVFCAGGSVDDLLERGPTSPICTPASSPSPGRRCSPWPRSTVPPSGRGSTCRWPATWCSPHRPPASIHGSSMAAPAFAERLADLRRRLGR